MASELMREAASQVVALADTLRLTSGPTVAVAAALDELADDILDGRFEGDVANRDASTATVNSITARLVDALAALGDPIAASRGDRDGDSVLRRDGAGPIDVVVGASRVDSLPLDVVEALAIALAVPAAWSEFLEPIGGQVDVTNVEIHGDVIVTLAATNMPAVVPTAEPILMNTLMVEGVEIHVVSWVADGRPLNNYSVELRRMLVDLRP